MERMSLLARDGFLGAIVLSGLAGVDVFRE